MELWIQERRSDHRHFYKQGELLVVIAHIEIHDAIMYQGKLRKITIILLAAYTLLTIYFLYIGFGRAAFIQSSTFRYNLVFGGIPLHFPMGRDFQIWFFELGNFLAFIPFGIVIPLLYRCSFIRFIIVFILSITLLETLQMVSRLGAFDVDDIIINTLGAAVGFWAQRFVSHDRDTFKGFYKILITAAVLSIVAISSIGGINQYLSKGGGEVAALNDLTLTGGTVLWDDSLSSFTVNGQKIEPQTNLYSRKNTRTNEFTYRLNGNYGKIAGYVVIPDDVIDTANQGNSDIIFIADGTEIYSIGLSAKSGENQLISFEIPLNGAAELTIQFSNSGLNPITNAVMWDVMLTEVNAGQRLINRIKRD